MSAPLHEEPTCQLRLVSDPFADMLGHPRPLQQLWRISPGFNGDSWRMEWRDVPVVSADVVAAERAAAQQISPTA
jgi:hypothetical protein